MTDPDARIAIAGVSHHTADVMALEAFRFGDEPGFLEAARELQQLQPLFASVTYGAGGSTQSNTLEICEQLIRTCGFEIMPHLTGVAANQDKIDGFLNAIKVLGIDNVLALRGDRPNGFTGTDAELSTTSEKKERIRSSSTVLSLAKMLESL